VRFWLNLSTVVGQIVPVRACLIRYMCRLSDAELRAAGTRQMTELLWSAVKEPLEPHMAFDRDMLTLALKYLTCSTLTIRLTGISQITVSLAVGYFEVEKNDHVLIQEKHIKKRNAKDRYSCKKKQQPVMSR
jgi:ubiquitin carboxyl-terminal hydrolase 34